MNAYIELLRPVTGVMAVIGVLIGAALVGINFSPIPVHLFVVIAVTFMICSAGMVLNDYFDFHIDKINKPHRPLPSGRVGRRAVLYFAALLYGAAMGLTLLLSMQLIFLALFNCAATAVYAWKLKRTPAGNFIVAWLAASTFLFGALLAQLSLTVWAIVGMAFTVNVARETVKAVEDYKGDKAAGARTLPVAFGRDVASWLAVAFLFLGIALSPVPYILKSLGDIYLILIVPADMAAIWACTMIFQNAASAQKWAKAAMCIMLAAIVLDILF